MDNQFKLQDIVRAFELDAQGIVNNACYFQYFDNARTQALHQKGINWVDLHLDGIDIVLIHTDISFKRSLVAFDQYEITTSFFKSGKLRIRCEQQLIRLSDALIVCSSTNTLACINQKTKKPVLNEAISQLFV